MFTDFIIRAALCLLLFGWPIAAILTMDRQPKSKNTYTPIVYRNE